MPPSPAMEQNQQGSSGSSNATQQHHRPGHGLAPIQHQNEEKPTLVGAAGQPVLKASANRESDEKAPTNLPANATQEEKQQALERALGIRPAAEYIHPPVRDSQHAGKSIPSTFYPPSPKNLPHIGGKKNAKSIATAQADKQVNQPGGSYGAHGGGRYH